MQPQRGLNRNESLLFRSSRRGEMNNNSGSDTDDVVGRASRHSYAATMHSVRERQDWATDVETGIDGGMRGHCASIRPKYARTAMPPRERRRLEIANWFRPITEPETVFHTYKHGKYNVATGNLLGPMEPAQYCLQAARPKSNHPKWDKCKGWLCLKNPGYLFYDESNLPPGSSFKILGVQPNTIFTNFLLWMFRQTLITVLLTAALCFLFMTNLFALFVYFAGKRNPQCIGGLEDDGYENYIDSFQLSWTTFTTVGYGAIQTNNSGDVADILNCTALSIILSLESFLGLLFVSIAGAIGFAKVSRLQSFAMVKFCDPIVVRYGSGVVLETSNEDDDRDQAKMSKGLNPARIPCPILEFRVVNRMHGILRGEIINSSIKVVASIEASQACSSSVIDESSVWRKGGKRGNGQLRPTARLRQQSASVLAFGSVTNLDAPFSNGRRRELSNISEMSNGSVYTRARRAKFQSLEEDPSGVLVPKHILAPLEIAGSEHPFFKRIWTIRHKLDHTSPLLKTSVRLLVKLNRGFWPKELNSPEGVRSAIHFDQLLVNFSGTSNSDANTVHAHMVYDFNDMHVGYRFVNMLFRDENDGSLKVDKSLLNDVTEQAGTDPAEDFNSVPLRKRRDSLEL